MKKNSAAAAAATALPLAVIFLIVTLPDAAGLNMPTGVVKAISAAIAATQSALTEVETQLKARGNSAPLENALKDCASTLSSAVSRMSDSKSSKANTKSDAQTWMSSALTDINTCSAGLKRAKVSPRQSIATAFNLITAALAAVAKLR